MKKKVFIFGAFIFLGAILFTGCGSSPKVHDKTVPLEQSSTINLNQCLLIGMDGNDVRYGNQLKMVPVIIPAGRHTLKFYASNESVGYNTVRTTFNEVSVTYTFIPGRTYKVQFVGSDLNIADITPGVTDGLLTINGLEAFNGQYIFFAGGADKTVVGSRERVKADFRGTKIENGVAEIPVFNFYGYEAFSGNNRVSNVTFYIGTEEIFKFLVVIRDRPYTDGRIFTQPQIQFIEGKASINFRDLTPR